MDRQDIKDAGLKVTVPRIRILEILENSEHLTAETLYQKLREARDEISLATVYRVLLDFEKAGLVVRHQFEDGHAIFELNRGKHHDHMVCLSCGRIIEFVNETIERQQKLIADKHGFEIRHHALIIYGLCSNKGCRTGATTGRLQSAR
jgi:Fur family transcriptional regulator, ferric uptake regulator